MNEDTADESPEPVSSFNDFLGLEITTSRSDLVIATWDVGPQHRQPYGIVHGGIHCSVVETLASIGAAAHAGPEHRVVGVHNSTDFTRAVKEGRLTSAATPIHQGRSSQLWLVETHDADGRLVARGQVRLQTLR
ncbi:PaaI family thioesterase [Nocardioides sp. NPDC051685]|uniref:PaaI family thioesterase n=1 Tax=Nocardioides sp. NPDC051685 TaxID=3364334 RepID=UPI0037A97769